jgi:hypothetical protein
MTPTSNALARHSVESWGIHKGVFVSTAKSAALTLAIVALWSFTHVYKGITGDAELYALQALSRLRPALATDLYLQNGSQDRFTIFSPLYGWFIQRLGLQTAAMALTLVSTVWFLVAAWIVARKLSTTATAFLAVASLIVIKGMYGSYDVFSYSENWLTARTVAEALVVTAIASHFLGQKPLALLIAVVALSIHPIMALPGLLLLLCLSLPLRIALLGAVLGATGALGLAVVASIHPTQTGMLAIMDPAWLEVVRERAQFLFLQYWTREDWEVNSRAFLYLLVYSCILGGDARKLCIAAAIVGATGLIVAAIAGLIGPVPLLLQGQAWRWVWITSFTGVLLLAPAVMKAWGDEKCGPLCALLLVLGWTFPVLDRVACVALALMLWLTRHRFTANSARYLNWAAAALAAIVLVWTIANAWNIAFSTSPETGRDPLAVAHLRNILGLGSSAAMLVVLLFYVIMSTRSGWVLAVLSAVLAAGTAVALPGTLKNGRDASPDMAEFAAWRQVIPPAGVVYVVPAHNSAAFAWFTLERPSYLTVDQSAGVVFSRATAMEVKRRSEVLLPLLDPDWRLLSANRRKKSGKPSEKSPSRPLTAKSLVSICGDSVLDFVVAKENVGFDPIRQTHAGAWKDWNLYDCRRTRSGALDK